MLKRNCTYDEDPKIFNNFRDFIDQCLCLNPKNRFTPESAFQHPFLPPTDKVQNKIYQKRQNKLTRGAGRHTINFETQQTSLGITEVGNSELVQKSPKNIYIHIEIRSQTCKV